MNNQEPVGEALDGLRTENIVLQFVAPQSRSTTMLPHRASFRIIFARSRLTNTSPTGSWQEKWDKGTKKRSRLAAAIRKVQSTTISRLKTYQAGMMFRPKVPPPSFRLFSVMMGKA